MIIWLEKTQIPTSTQASVVSCRLVFPTAHLTCPLVSKCLKVFQTCRPFPTSPPSVYPSPLTPTPFSPMLRPQSLKSHVKSMSLVFIPNMPPVSKSCQFQLRHTGGTIELLHHLRCPSRTRTTFLPRLESPLTSSAGSSLPRRFPAGLPPTFCEDYCVSQNA